MGKYAEKRVILLWQRMAIGLERKFKLKEKGCALIIIIPDRILKSIKCL